MTDPSASANTSSVPVEEQAIRERVRELTAQVLAGGPLNTEGVQEVVRTMSWGAVFKPPRDDARAREAFASFRRDTPTRPRGARSRARSSA